jgi:lysozyme
MTDYTNPPLPSGLALLPENEVTPAMRRWAIMVDNSSLQYPMHSINLDTIDGRKLAAVVCWHTETYRGGKLITGHFWGVTLYDASDYNDDEAVPTPPAPTGQLLEGVDVSHYQGTIDWAQVFGAGKSFALVKASEGASKADPMFSQNWAESKATGMKRGAYQFLRPAESVKAQVDLFLAKLGGDFGELAPTVDVEVLDGCAPQAVEDAVSQWLDLVNTETQMVPLVYTSPGFWAMMPHNTNIATKSGLWLAEWGIVHPQRMPGAWSDWYAWQYTNKARVPGIPEPVDLDRINGVDFPGQS